MNLQGFVSARGLHSRSVLLDKVVDLFEYVHCSIESEVLPDMSLSAPKCAMFMTTL